MKWGKVFVTGADGFIGSHLCEALRDAGAEVTGLAQYNSFDTFGWLDDVEEIKKVRGDICDPGLMIELIDGHDMVFHLAALMSVPYSYSAPHSFVSTNEIGTLNVIWATLVAEAKLIHASTSEVYGSVEGPITEDQPSKPQSPYAASKVAADAWVTACHLSYDLAAVILRPFNTYGPRQSERSVIPSIIRQVVDPGCPAIQIGNAAGARDFMYVEDTVKAFLAVAALDGFGVYNAGTGKSICIQALVWRIMKLARKSKEIKVAEERQRPERSEVTHLLADATKLTMATGWKPEVDLDEGLRRTIAWWKDYEFRDDAAYMT